MALEFGILSLSDIQQNPRTGKPFPTVQRLDEIVGYAILADQLGLDRFALGEHHTLDFAVSSPAVVLASIARATRAIRLTTAVTVLSVLDPVRVYQDFATLDLLSRGRAEIIAGRSAFLEPFALFGVELADYDAVFSEKLELLLRLRDESHVTWTGASRPSLVDAPIAPRAFQDPLPVSVGVGGSPESADRAGRLGLPMVLGLIGGSIAGVRRTVDIYRAAGDRAGHPEKMSVGISTHFYAGASDSAAREVFPNYREYLRPKTPGGRGFVVDERSFVAGTAAGQALMIGSVDEITEKIILARDVLGIDRFYGQVDWGGLPKSQVEDSIARLAQQVVPAVKGAIA